MQLCPNPEMAFVQAKMDAASGEEQIVLKKKLLNFLERYFYLVCFGAYCRMEGEEHIGQAEDKYRIYIGQIYGKTRTH